MDIKAKIYRDVDGDGVLMMVGKGTCSIYEPMAKDGKDLVHTDHITLAFENFRVQLDRKDFLKFERSVK